MPIITPDFNYTTIPPDTINHSELTNNIQPDNISAIVNLPIHFVELAVGDAWGVILYVMIITVVAIKLKHAAAVAFTSFFVSTVFAVMLPEDFWCKYLMMMISVVSLAAAIYTLVKR